MLIVDKADLPGPAPRFDGIAHGGVPMSFFLSEPRPGCGPSLHRHDYDEIFVVYDGAVTATVGDESAVVCAGQIAVVPAGTPHKFVNHTARTARLIALHATSEIATEWLDE